MAFSRHPVRQRAALILLGASVLVVGVALAQKSFQVFVNGKATSKPAIRQGNETYIPLSTLVAAGVPVKTSGSRIEITLAAGNTIVQRSTDGAAVSIWPQRARPRSSTVPSRPPSAPNARG